MLRLVVVYLSLYVSVIFASRKILEITVSLQGSLTAGTRLARAFAWRAGRLPSVQTMKRSSRAPIVVKVRKGIVNRFVD